MLNATGYIVNMQGKPDSLLRSLTDSDFQKLNKKYGNNPALLPWMKGCVRFWLQRSGR